MHKNIFLAKSILVFCAAIAMLGCNVNGGSKKNDALHLVLSNYWEDNLKLHPFLATAVGDRRYNHLFPNNQTDSFRKAELAFYNNYLAQVNAIDATALSEEDKLNAELLQYELQTQIREAALPFYLMPINQFWSFTLEFPQLGSGSGNQPFASVQDYDNFNARLKAFPAWVDSAIGNMRQGIAQGYVLPTCLAQKVVPQLQAIVVTDPTKSIFYEPINKLPKAFGKVDKARLTSAYFFNISNSIIPAYARLAAFMKNEYVPACRKSTGIGALPQGREMYAHLIQLYTTTQLSADSIYNLGLQQVAFLRSEMEKVKTQVGFNGSLQQFFASINTDKQFMPFTTPQQVLDSFARCKNIIDGNLKNLFTAVPKTKFEIRQTEAFRQASASAEYSAGSEDGTRPGVFYVPIIDATKFNVVGMETLFLHEAIPGHHFQISLQQENKNLPQFRKFLDYSAYAEGWALYTESLGKELGMYKNPYQYLGHLSDAMHRAIRLVVDAGMHSKTMTREEAIAYMMNNERITQEEATAEIERYMAIPGQALSYMVGKLTIQRMRARYEKELGNKFSLPAFHEQLLNAGNMPLGLMEKKLDRWAASL